MRMAIAGAGRHVEAHRRGGLGGLGKACSGAHDGSDGNRSDQDLASRQHGVPPLGESAFVSVLTVRRTDRRSVSRRSTMASGRFTSAASSWGASMNATTSSGLTENCYPLLPVYSVTYLLVAHIASPPSRGPGLTRYPFSSFFSSLKKRQFVPFAMI